MWKSLGEEFELCSLLGLVATESVLRVDVDVLKGAEGRQDLAVVHALEDGNELVLVKDASHRDIVSLCLVLSLFPFEVLDDPQTTVGLVFVALLDQLFAKAVIEVFGGLVSHRVGPVEHFLVDVSALGQFHVELLEVGVGLSGLNVDPLAALEFDAH